MHLTRFAEAKPYQAPGHDQMHMLRLLGREAGPADTLWMGMSHLLPGGGTTLEASPIEKMYIVLAGSVQVGTDAGSEILGVWDSCRIAPNEPRRLYNPGNAPATILLVMPLAPKG